MLLDQIKTKTERYNQLNSRGFYQCDFESQLEFLRLQNELAYLHLAAADLIGDKDLIACGKHLKQAIHYHPYLLPKLTDLRKPFYQIFDSPVLDKLRDNLADNNVLKGFGFIFAAPTILLGKIASIIPHGMYHLGAEYVEKNYVESHCLHDIPSNLTSEECLYQALAYLHLNHDYLALRYFLEAEIRAQGSLVEIQKFISICLSRFLNWNNSYLFTVEFNRESQDNNFLENFNLIIQKVLRSNSTTSPQCKTVFFADTDLKKIAKKYFDIRYSKPYFGSENLHSLIDKFNHSVIYRTDNQAKRQRAERQASIYNMSIQSTKEGFAPLVRHTVYLSHFFNASPLRLQLIVNDPQLNEDDSIKQERNYLEKLDSNSSPAVTVSIDSDQFTETLALLLEENHFEGCRKLQSESIAKYWSKLYLVLYNQINSSLPIDLKNPLVYMHQCLLKYFVNHTSRIKFFQSLVKSLLQSKGDFVRISNALNQRMNFSDTYLYNIEDKLFFNTLEALDILCRHNVSIQSMITDYQQFINSQDDSIQFKSAAETNINNDNANANDEDEDETRDLQILTGPLSQPMRNMKK